MRRHTSSEQAIQQLAYQLNLDSMPACLNHSATYSAVPAKIAAVNA